jgi:putative transposase
VGGGFPARRHRRRPTDQDRVHCGGTPNRACLGGLVDGNITSDDLVAELDRLAVDRGYPAVLRCDKGPELACAAMADLPGERTGLHFIPPGQPWRNGYVESFNSRVRDECLNINVLVASRRHAR